MMGTTQPDTEQRGRARRAAGWQGGGPERGTDVGSVVAGCRGGGQHWEVRHLEAVKEEGPAPEGPAEPDTAPGFHSKAETTRVAVIIV